MKAKTGDTVKVDYVGTAEDKMFDTSIKEEAEKGGIYNEQRPYEPLEFEIGAGQMIPGFDKAVVGMGIDEEKTVELPPEEAYGEYNPELVKEVPIDVLQGQAIPEIGSTVGFMTAQGPLRGTVKEIADDKIIVDFNPELAGKTLTFKIIMREINP